MTAMQVVTVIVLMIATHLCYSEWAESEVTRQHGHYPYFYCHITNAMLKSSDGVFYAKAADSLLDRCRSDAVEIWTYAGDENLSEYDCTDSYDVGHVFTVYYYSKGSNYYHLHLDMLFPLYKAVHLKEDMAENETRILMPTVETSRLQEVNWDTDAFKDKTKYWNSMLRYFSKSEDIRPLDRNFRESGKNICFKNLYLGTPNIRYNDASIIMQFAKYMKKQLNIDQDAWKKYKRPLIGIISRSNRRRILNEDELVKAVQSLGVVHLLKLENMSYRQQVDMMQKYTVLVGINGAGLMNGIYLPPHGVCIQLVPYKSPLNHEMYGEILRARGPYLVWHNKREMHHKPVPDDTSNNRPDTIVHVGEFRALVLKTLDMVSDARKELYQEENAGMEKYPQTEEEGKDEHTEKDQKEHVETERKDENTQTEKVEL